MKIFLNSFQSVQVTFMFWPCHISVIQFCKRIDPQGGLPREKGITILTHVLLILARPYSRPCIVHLRICNWMSSTWVRIVTNNSKIKRWAVHGRKDVQTNKISGTWVRTHLLWKDGDCSFRIKQNLDKYDNSSICEKIIWYTLIICWKLFITPWNNCIHT